MIVMYMLKPSIHLLINVLVYSQMPLLIQQMFIEHLLCASPWIGCWEHSSENTISALMELTV